MSQQKPDGRAPAAHEFEGVLRLPDGSVDIAAYTVIAHRERAVTITFSTGATIRKVRGMLSAFGMRLAAVVRSLPASGKHGAPVAR